MSVFIFQEEVRRKSLACYVFNDLQELTVLFLS